MLNSFQKYDDESEEEEEDVENKTGSDWIEKYAIWIVVFGVLLFINIPLTAWIVPGFVYWILMVVMIFILIIAPCTMYASSNDYYQRKKKRKKRRKKVKKKLTLPKVPVRKTDIFDRRETLQRTKRKFEFLVGRIRIWGSICIITLVLLNVPSLNYYIPKILERLIYIFILIVVLVLFIEFATTRQYRRVRKKKEISEAQKEKASLLGFSVEEITFDGGKRKRAEGPFPDSFDRFGQRMRKDSDGRILDDDEPPRPVYLSVGQPQTYHDYWAEKYRQSSHARRGDDYDDEDDAINDDDDMMEEGFDDGFRGFLPDEDPFDFISHGRKGKDGPNRGGSRFMRVSKSTHRSSSHQKPSHSQPQDIGPGQDSFSSFDLLIQDQIPLGSGYMREIEDVNELEHLTARMNEFKKIIGPQGDQSSSSRSPYRRPSRTSSDRHHRFSTNQSTQQQRNYRKSYLARDPTSESDKEQDRNAHMKTLQRFGISPFMMSIWMKNMRGWISRKIIQPISHYVQQSDKKFRRKGLRNYDCSHVLASPPGPYHRIPEGLRKSKSLAYDIKRNPLTLMYILKYLQGDRTLCSIILDRRRLEGYLKLSFCFSTRPYQVRRLRELASSYAAFKWEAGSNKNWSRALATDAELMMQFVVNFFNQIIPSSDKLVGKTMFSQNHFVDRTRGGDDNKHISKNGLYISMEKKDPPHFAVIWEGRVLKTEKGQNNIFFTLCLFAYILKTKYDSNLGRSPGSKKYVGPGSQYNLMECLT